MRRAALLATLVASLAAATSASAASPPTVTTGPSTVNGSTATVTGTVNPAGQPTTYSFQYGTTTAYGQTTTPASAGTGTANVPVNASLTNLVPGVTYHYRVTATNASGTNSGQDATFTVAAIAPTAKTGPVQGVSDRAATLTGTLSTGGGTTTYYFELGTSTSYRLRTEPVTVAAGTPPAPGQAAPTQQVKVPIDGLRADQTFHYRLVAVNSAGTSTGADATFKTLAGNRVAPVSVGAHTTPGTAVAYPYRFTTTGTITPPAGANRTRACSGFVAVRFKNGSRTISLRRASVGPNCRYSSHVTFSIPRRVRRGALKVTALFSGNGVLRPRAAPVQTVYVG